MSRIKRGVATHRKHKKIRKAVKGYIHTRRASIRKAKEAILKAGQHAYIDRKKKKRTIKRTWILKINAGLRKQNTTYSKFVNLLKRDKIALNKKVMAEMAEKEPKAFEKFVKLVLK